MSSTCSDRQSSRQNSLPGKIKPVEITVISPKHDDYGLLWLDQLTREEETIYGRVVVCEQYLII